MAPTKAEQALYEDLLSIYARAGAEVTYVTDDGQVKPYWAKRFLQAVKRAEKNEDLFGFVDRLLRPEQPSRGFLILKKADRLDLTVEALVINSKKSYYKNIPFELITIARRRLADHGYEDAFSRESQEPAAPSKNLSGTETQSLMLSPGTSFDVRVTVGDDGALSFALI